MPARSNIFPASSRIYSCWLHHKCLLTPSSMSASSIINACHLSLLAPSRMPASFFTYACYPHHLITVLLTPQITAPLTSLLNSTFIVTQNFWVPSKTVAQFAFNTHHPPTYSSVIQDATNWSHYTLSFLSWVLVFLAEPNPLYTLLQGEFTTKWTYPFLTSYNDNAVTQTLISATRNFYSLWFSMSGRFVLILFVPLTVSLTCYLCCSPNPGSHLSMPD